MKLAPRSFGGEQERKRRAGTENLASIVGFHEAVKISRKTANRKRSAFIEFKEIFIQYLTENKY